MHQAVNVIGVKVVVVVVVVVVVRVRVVVDENELACSKCARQ